MAGAQVEISQNRLEKGDKGLLALSLTEYGTDLECKIAAGSTLEIAGALFEFPALESITGWGGIGINNDVYVKLVVAGTSVTAEFTTTAPTWSDSKQGWYGTAGAALHRYVAKLHKDGSGNYTKKHLLIFSTQGLALLGSGALVFDGSVNAKGVMTMESSSDVHAQDPAAGDVVWLAADADVSTTSGAYVKMKEMVAPATGIYRIVFDLWETSAVQTAYGRIYKNGAAFGTERSNQSTNPVTYTEDLAFTAGDLVQLWAKNVTASNTHVRNFRLKSVEALPSVFGAILQGSLVKLDA